MIDVEETKKKILSILNEKGPSLPVKIAREIKLSPMFTSAILSELTNTQQVKLSSLKVGSSPLYLLPGHEEKLENFSENLAGVEKTAFSKLKEKKVLQDTKQEPAIRVALRSIKDFAKAFRFKDEIYWKYSFASQEEINQTLSGEKPTKTEKEPEKKEQKTFQKIEPIFEKPKKTTKKPQKKSNQNFLEEIKPLLEEKNIQILELEEVSKKAIIAKAKAQEEIMLFAFNKKRITDKELMRCFKKSQEKNLKYLILTRGEPTKKMQDTFNAYKNLLKIDQIAN